MSAESSAYDLVPYVSLPFPQSHPTRMGEWPNCLVFPSKAWHEPAYWNWVVHSVESCDQGKDVTICFQKELGQKFFAIALNSK